MEDIMYMEDMMGGSPLEEIMGGFALAYGLFCLLVSALFIVCQWRMFLKMGEPGWVCLIPFYNLFVMAKHSFGNGWAMFVPLIPVVGVPWFFIRLFKGFGMADVPAILLAIFASPIGMLIFGLNRTPWMGM